MRGRPRKAAWAVLAIVVAVLLTQSTWWETNQTVFAQAVVSGLLIGGVYSLVAMGLSLVFGVLDIINFAHGALMTIGIYASYLLFDNYGIDPYVSLLITIPLLFVVGVGIQRFAINAVMDAPVHNQLLLTLGIAIVIENLALVLFTGTPRSIELSYARNEFDLGLFSLDFPIRLFGAVITLPKLIAFSVAILLAAVLYLLIHRTQLGTAIRAAAQEPEGAEMVGIDVRRIYMITFGIGAACVGAAGALVMPFLFVSPTAGATFNIIAFIVVVLGGMGSIPGALVGGLVIGLTQEMTQLFVSGSSKLMGVFVVFLAVLLVRPQGLFGKVHR
ncbi:MAG TPA: branched-chain amino acid ABC transporter permease [Acidimicrobiia bacterium]|nr:branched-chain amino acid ABC transporter permease [Acidimicrobiia bacterium]